MTISEFSNEFDIMYDNASNQAPGLSEYEKSVFLTKAQEDVVRGLYNGTVKIGESFDTTEENQRLISSLIETTKLIRGIPVHTNMPLSKDSVIYVTPPSLMYVVYEAVYPTNQPDNSKPLPIYPVTLDEYYRVINNPFRRFNKKRVLRVIANSGIFMELIPHESVELGEYLIRYIAKPDPIILEELTDGVSINGETEPSTCKLDESIHRIILQQAVVIALGVFGLDQQPQSK